MTQETIYDYPPNPRVPKTRPAGAELQKLKPHHWRVVLLYMEGATTKEICREVGVARDTVMRVMKDPEVRAELDGEVEAARQRLRSLFHLSLDALAQSLRSDDAKERLAAVDRVSKLLGGGEPPPTTNGDGGADVDERRRALVQEVERLAQQKHGAHEPADAANEGGGAGG